MKDVFIIDGLRTAIGERSRSLKDISAAKLAAVVIRALLKKNNIKAKTVDELILGNAVSAGLGQNVARQSLVHAGMPFSVPAFTVNKVCGSGLKSVILAAQAIACGSSDMIIAGGTENVSQCPYILPRNKRNGIIGREDLRDSLVGDGLWCNITNQHMGMIAEYTAKRFKISREEQDDYAFRSQDKACLAQKFGLFKREIVPVKINTGSIINSDEKPRKTSINELARIPPAFKLKGTVTAGNSPGPADGAAVLILASKEALKRFKLKASARILASSVVALNPMLTFTAPALAIKKCLKLNSLKISEIDLFEINEAFAVQSLLTIRDTGLDQGRLNIFGGAIALGHPLGASGARSLVTLINALKTQRKKIGITSICLGGGSALSLAIQIIKE